MALGPPGFRGAEAKRGGLGYQKKGCGDRYDATAISQAPPAAQGQWQAKGQWQAQGQWQTQGGHSESYNGQANGQWQAPELPQEQWWDPQEQWNQGAYQQGNLGYQPM